ncbi:hypothetical protein AYK24_04990 [Thermoplasmatales archaeon SG8-52-4]|nr:MAG: hypothetical protein AYK24_04990 [Thermoplasmatales archaeon SG8-52-4]
MKYDIIIVGAGPAGSTAAYFLAKKGYKVLLIDKHKFPRNKPCGGGIPMAVFKRFSYLTKYNIVDSYCYGGYVHSPSLKYFAEAHSEKPVIAMVSREKFDFGLVRIAQENGAEFLDGKKVKDVQVFHDKVTVTLGNDTKISSDVIIGADGISGDVAKKIGLTPKQRKVNVCVFQEYKLNEQILDKFATDKRLSHIHIMYHNIPGYAWLFTKKDSINIGIGEFVPYKKYVKQEINLINSYKSYFQEIKKQKLIPDDLKIGKIKGGIIPTNTLRQTYSDRVIICGDAAGFINPLSGGGIQFAMISGENAAKTLNDAFKNDNFKSSFLSRYQNLWMDEFGKDFKTFLRFSKIYLLQAERFIKIASKDERLSKIMLEYLYGNNRIIDYRKRLLSYYILGRIKDAFGLL